MSRPHLLAVLVLGLLALLGVSATFAAAADEPSQRRQRLLAEQLLEWNDPALRAGTVEVLRRDNPEWDFMWRTFLVLSLADQALAEPAREEELLAVMDSVIDDTLAAEAEHGQRWYLLSYADRAPFVDPADRSIFVDGEVALILGARRLVAEHARYARLHRERDELIAAQLRRSPALLAESYPDEAWLFCNTNALVALRMADVLDGSDHSQLIEDWTERADQRLREPTTGMLGSEFTWRGRMMDGPEGSSIWLVATNLLLLDEELARDQYERAREHLVDSSAGFGWAREWSEGLEGPVDVDSGPIVPILEASASSSGFALLAARAFGDEPTRQDLERSLDVADLLLAVMPGMAELSDNAVGEAVVLRALGFGPLWEEIRERSMPAPEKLAPVGGG